MPLRQVLDGFEPGPLAQAAMQRELGAVDAFRSARVELLHEPRLGSARITELLSEAPAATVLVIDVTPRLDAKLEFLVVRASAKLYPAGGMELSESQGLSDVCWEPDPQPKLPLYAAVLETSLEGPPGKGSERWTRDGGAAARWAIEGGLAELARMLAFDLQQPGPADGSYAIAGVDSVRLRQFLQARAWYPISAKGSRKWFRSKDGSLASVGSTYPGFDVSAAARFAPARPVEEKVVSELPEPAPGGGLTFSFATPRHVRQGGSVALQAASERPNDVFFLEKPALSEGMLQLKGQLGYARGWGSRWRARASRSNRSRSGSGRRRCVPDHGPAQS